MPNARTTLAPPSEGDRVGPIHRIGNAYYSILKSGEVWCEPDDETGHYIAEKEYPPYITEKIMQQRMLEPANLALQMRELAERHIHRCVISEPIPEDLERIAGKAFHEHWKLAILAVSEHDQKQIKVRVFLASRRVAEDARVNVFLVHARAVLKEHGFEAEIGHVLQEGPHSLGLYVPVTIKW